jgi:cell filamentation protein
MSEYNYEYEWDSKYCYPNSFVLKNKLNIRDAKELAEAERRITALNLLEIKGKPVRGQFDLKHLRETSFALPNVSTHMRMTFLEN